MVFGFSGEPKKALQPVILGVRPVILSAQSVILGAHSVILSEAKDLREASAQVTASRGFFAFGSE